MSSAMENVLAIDCGDVKLNGGMNFTVPIDRSLGQNFTFLCDDGYTLRGMSSSTYSHVVVCESSGRWSLGNLTCAGQILLNFPQK